MAQAAGKGCFARSEALDERVGVIYGRVTVVVVGVVTVFCDDGTSVRGDGWAMGALFLLLLMSYAVEQFDSVDG